MSCTCPLCHPMMGGCLALIYIQALELSIVEHFLKYQEVCDLLRHFAHQSCLGQAFAGQCCIFPVGPVITLVDRECQP